jgi:dimethylargininase
MPRQAVSVTGVEEKGEPLFTRAIVRKPGENFAGGLTSFRGEPPDYVKALEQHDAYCRALERCGLRLTFLDPDLRYHDSAFVEDVAVLARRSAILTRPGAPSRQGEVAAIRPAIEQFFSTIHEITAPGTLDGGDICEAGNHFFIGISRRTNEAGASQLAAFLAGEGFTSSFVDIRGMRSILHLKSGIASIGGGKLVVIEELAGHQQFGGYSILRIAPEETYAANCLRVNDRLLVPAGYPGVERLLRGLGCEVVTLEMSEFRKMDGGLSCLSLRF